MKVPASTSVAVALLGLAACGEEPCPEGSTRRADGLCYLDDTTSGDDSGTPAGDSGPDTGGDTGSTTVEWVAIPAGCEVTTSPHEDPLVEVGSYFVQNDLFAEGTDIELAGDVAWTAGQGGMWSVDISDPANPTFLGQAEEGGGRWYNIHPGPDDAIYVSSRDAGFAVFDGSDPAQPRMANQSWGEGLAGMRSADDRLYVASLQGTLVTYDISNPLVPELVDEMTGLANAWAVELSGSRAFVADNTLGLVVVDLSDPDMPAMVGSFETAGGAQDLALAADGSAVYVATGGAGVETFSLADPDAPESLGAIDVSYSVISVATGGDTLWAVNHQDVVAIDVSEPLTPALVNTEQTDQWSMHVAADADRAWVADWGFIRGYELVSGASAPDADLSTGQVFLPNDGGGVTITLANLGGSALELAGASSSDERLSMEADRLTVEPGERARVRLEWEGGEDLDATVCIATDDPDEPTLELVASGNQDGNPALGTAAPDFTLQGLDGETYTLSEQLGRPVFIAYFATW